MAKALFNLEKRITDSEEVTPSQAIARWESFGGALKGSLMLYDDGSIKRGSKKDLGTIPVYFDMANNEATIGINGEIVPYSIKDSSFQTPRAYMGLDERGKKTDFLTGFYGPVLTDRDVIEYLREDGQLNIPRALPWTKNRRRSGLMEYLGIQESDSEDIDALISEKLTGAAYNVARTELPREEEVESEDGVVKGKRKISRKQATKLAILGLGAARLSSN